MEKVTVKQLISVDYLDVSVAATVLAVLQNAFVAHPRR